MNWDFQLGSAAQNAFRSIPAKDRERINRAFNDMKTDPLSGDIVSLKGEHRGQFRRRVGSWRIVFQLKVEERIVLVADSSPLVDNLLTNTTYSSDPARCPWNRSIGRCGFQPSATPQDPR